MAGRHCGVGCKCARHRGWTRSAEANKRLSDAIKGHTVSQETRDAISKSLTGRKRPEEEKAAISKTLKGRKFTDAHKDGISKGMQGNLNFWGGGGDEGAFYVALFLSLGYQREQRIYWDSKDHRSGNFKIDFLLKEEKVAIELDGPGHGNNPQKDVNRDHVLRLLGYHVIRIRHT